MKKLYLILTFLSFASFGLTAQFTVEGFKGVKTTEDPLLIGEDKSPDMDNCDPSEDGLSLSRRDGQTSLFVLNHSSYSVKSFGKIRNNSYDRLLIGYDKYVYAVDTAYFKTVIHSSATAAYQWDFTQNQEYTYATNGTDTVFKTDGNTKIFISSAPKGTSIAFYNNTCFIANVASNHARVYYAQYGDPTDWTTGVEPTDARFVDVADYGEKVVDLETLANGVLVLCSNSIMKMLGTGNPYQVIEVDKSVGCKSKGSVTTYLGFTYFLGSDGQMYRTDGTDVEDISSDEFREAFAATKIAVSESNFSAISDEMGWETGVSSHTSTSIMPGSVVLSTGTYVATTSTTWNTWTRVDTDTTTLVGSVTLAKYGYFDQFTDGNYTSNPSWGVAAGSHWSVVLGELNAIYGTGTNDLLYAAIPTLMVGQSNYQIEFDVLFHDMDSTSDYLNFTVYDDSPVDSVRYFIIAITPIANEISVVLKDNTTLYTRTFNPTIAADVQYTFKIKQEGSGFSIYIDDGLVASFTTPFSTALVVEDYMMLQAFLFTNNSYLTLDNFVYNNNYKISGKITSPIIDSGFNKPIWGTLSWTNTTPVYTTNLFYVRSSTSPTMGDNPSWVAAQSYSGGPVNSVSSKRYVQLYSTMTSVDTVGTPTLNDITLIWSTTGYYITPPTVISNIANWDLFQAGETLNGGGITYYVAQSSYIVTATSLQTQAVWHPQSNGATIACSTNTYIYTKAVFSITKGTQTPSLDYVAYNWISGSPSTFDTTSTWFEDRMYLGIQRTVASSVNDGVFVYDPKLKSWWSYKSGVYPSAFYQWKNKFLVASSTYGVVSQFLNGDTDLGASINAYYYTNQMSPKPLNIVSSLTDASIVFKRGTGSLSLNYYLNGSTTSEGTLTFTLSGGNPIRVDSFNFPERMNANVFQFKIANVDGCDFTLYNVLGNTNELPFRISK